MADVLRPAVASISDSAVAELVVREFDAIEFAYRLGNWKEVGLHAGHFVEAVRRVVEHQAFGSYTPVSKPLAALNTNLLSKLEASRSDDSIRFHIPRVLIAMYGIRNKRGIGHLSRFVANRLDAEMLVANSRWIMSELLRLSTGIEPTVLSEIAGKLAERPIAAVWQNSDTFRVLDSKLRPSDQVLLLGSLAGVNSLASMVSAMETTEANLKKVLGRLHKKRWIKFSQSDGSIELSPLGHKEARRLISRGSVV